MLTALTQCGGEMTSNSGMITTAEIEPYQLCVWRITVESDKRIILVIESVDLPTMTDWYRVFDGSDCLGKPTIYAKGITTEKPLSMKSTNNTVVFVAFGGKVKLTYTSGKILKQINKPAYVILPVQIYRKNVHRKTLTKQQTWLATPFPQ
ncbi:hypothetical protein AHF37_11761 [Paragonimus kellicotti]|nr:hypothetical protein AHF37_11761 [Paragonimus kellicotti]